MKRGSAERYAMFGLLYFSQGTILSYFTALNGLYFLSRGLTMTDVGIFASIALIPFIVKIFLGMLSDRVDLFHMGHRKPYILIGLIVQVVCLTLVSLVDPGEAYWTFVALAFVLQMGMALYDTCTDGLALDTTPEEDTGTIQTFMVGGRALGVVVTSSVVGLIAQHISWSAVFWLLAAFTLLPIPLVLRTREAIRPVERAFDWSAFSCFKNRVIIALAALGFVFFFIIAGANQLVNPFLETAYGIGLAQAGLYTTVWGIGVVLGSVVGGRMIDKISDRNATWVSLGIALAGTLILAVTSGPAMAWISVTLFGLSYGTYQTVYFALAMAHTEPCIAASMFSILMAVTNVAQGAGMGASGALVDMVGFRWTFVVLAALNALAIPLMGPVFNREDGACEPDAC